MSAKYSHSRPVFLFALLISILMLIVLPANTISAEAKEESMLLAGFTKISPANGIDNQPTTVTLRWNSAPSNPYGYGRYYKYCYYITGGICSFDGGLYTTQYTISGLTRGTRYFWQIQVVYCRDAACVQKERHEADDGQVWSFRTGGIEPPGPFVKLSPPDNTLNLTNRTLSWTVSSGATSYQVCYSPNFIDSNCAFLHGWREVGNVTSYTIPVPNDPGFIWGLRYYWQVRASNGGGTRLANEGASWTFTSADLVGKASLISPTGAITTLTPTYRWNQVTGVTWYYLWINGPAGNVFKQWYQSSAVCSAGTCSVTPSLTLGYVNLTWWVQTWSPTGYGPWSNSLTFSTPLPPVPGAATLAAPSGAISDPTPEYTWYRVNGATWYYLWVNNAAGTPVIRQWYMASQVCDSISCSVTPAVALPSGSYRWWIQTWNEGGYGPWSSAMSFSLP